MSQPGQQQMHGTSKYIVSTDKLYGEMEFQEFAPACCVCVACLAPEWAKTRMFAKVYDNRIVANIPFFPFFCFTCDEKCVLDRPMMIFHDRQPSRSGMFCYVLPCTCCGPPVIFVQKPVCCCCIDMTSCCGEEIRAAPCNCFGCKQYLCCGGPCYTKCSVPVFSYVKNGGAFLAKWKAALQDYYTKNDIDTAEMAIFEAVQDSEFDHQGAQKIHAEPVQATMAT